MSDSIAVALIAAAATLTGAFIAQFLAERFRRNLEAKALAAGIVGELSSYAGAAAPLSEAIGSWKDSARAGKKITLRPFERATDMFFDASVTKVGLLGAPLVEHVVFIYSNLRAFRLALDLLIRDHDLMTSQEFILRCDACLERINAAQQRGIVAMPLLRKMAA